MHCARTYLDLLKQTTLILPKTDIINMLEFLIDNIFIMFGGRVFQQTIGIHMGANYVPLLADLFLAKIR